MNSERGREVLEMLRRYRSAETAMLRRARSETGLGETDLLALRFLLHSAEPVSARDLAHNLAISPASVTMLVDRLAARGFVQRQPHPTDRRGVLVVALATSEDLRVLLTGDHPEILQAANTLNDETADELLDFLQKLIETLEAPRQATQLRRDAS